MTPDTSTKYIELNAFLKVVAKVAATGGQAKVIIRDGSVKVNGQIELRNKRKLHATDIVEHQGKQYIVTEEVTR